MKKLKHTRGPWKVAYQDKNIVVMPEKANKKGTGNQYCECAGGNHDNNARLISCAPEMLEALIFMIKHNQDLCEDCRIDAVKLIEKATGMKIEEVI